MGELLLRVVKRSSDMHGLHVISAEALSRVQETLMAWPEGTLAIVTDEIFRAPNRDQARALFRLAQHAAKGTEAHLGAVHGFWAGLERHGIPDRGKPLDEDARNDERQAFERCLQELERPSAMVPRNQLEKEIPVTGPVLEPAPDAGLVDGLHYAYSSVIAWLLTTTGTTRPSRRMEPST